MRRHYKAWSEEDFKFLEENYANSPVEETAVNLGRSVGSVRMKAHELGLVNLTLRGRREGFERSQISWEVDEIETLEEYYAGASAKDLSKVLGRTPDSIRRKAHDLGLLKDYRKDVKEFTLYKGGYILARGNLFEISQSLGIEYRSVRHYLTPSYISRTSEKGGRRLVYEGNRLLEEFGIDEEE